MPADLGHTNVYLKIALRRGRPKAALTGWLRGAYRRPFRIPASSNFGMRSSSGLELYCSYRRPPGCRTSQSSCNLLDSMDCNSIENNTLGNVEAQIWGLLADIEFEE